MSHSKIQLLNAAEEMAIMPINGHPPEDTTLLSTERLIELVSRCSIISFFRRSAPDYDRDIQDDFGAWLDALSESLDTKPDIDGSREATEDDPAGILPGPKSEYASTYIVFVSPSGLCYLRRGIKTKRIGSTSILADFIGRHRGPSRPFNTKARRLTRKRKI